MLHWVFLRAPYTFSTANLGFVEGFLVQNLRQEFSFAFLFLSPFQVVIEVLFTFVMLFVALILTVVPSCLQAPRYSTFKRIFCLYLAAALQNSLINLLILKQKGYQNCSLCKASLEERV